MVIKKGIVDLVSRLLPSNFWKTYLVETTGNNRYLKDVTIHNIIQSIHTKLINPGSQDTNIGLLKRQSAPQWSKDIRSYSAAITKNKYELTKMGFTTNYAVLVHHLKLHLEIFAQTPQGTSFTKLVDDWEKKYRYGHKFTKIHFNQLIKNVTISSNKRRQAPRYNKVDKIIDRRTPKVYVEMCPVTVDGPSSH